MYAVVVDVVVVCVRMGGVLLHDCMCESRGACIFCMYVFRM